ASPWQNGFASKADRVDATRGYGPHHCPLLGTPAPDSAHGCLLLQPDQNSPVIGQGCADLSPGSADRGHQFARHPWRTPSPLRPSLGFWYTQVMPARSSSATEPNARTTGTIAPVPV